MNLTERDISLLENMHVPNTYWKNKSESYMYWMRALYERLTSALDFKIPENWSRSYFYLVLFSFGWVPIFKTARWGVTFNPGSLLGYDWFYEPTHVQIANPKLVKKFTIGKDCEILRLTNDWHGVWDIISFYASKLAEASQGVDVALINAKMPLVLTASNQAQAETLKKVYDKIKLGESLVVYDTDDELFSDELLPQGDEPFQSFINDLKSNYIGTELLENINTILNQFYTEIGLPTQSSEHGKSHTLNIEAEQAEMQSNARLCTWLTNLEDGVTKVNNMFGIGMEVTKHEHSETDLNRDGERAELSE